MRQTPLGRVLLVLPLVAGAAIFVVPAEIKWVLLVVALVLVGVSIAHTFMILRQDRAAGEAILAAHPGETILPTSLFASEGVTRAERARVGLVLADRRGLSFRDRTDTEVLHVGADRILSIELGPLPPRMAIRPAIATLVDGPPISFWVGAQPDQQAEAVVALRTALGRAAG